MLDCVFCQFPRVLDLLLFLNSFLYAKSLSLPVLILHVLNPLLVLSLHLFPSLSRLSLEISLLASLLLLLLFKFLLTDLFFVLLVNFTLYILELLLADSLQLTPLELLIALLGYDLLLLSFHFAHLFVLPLLLFCRQLLQPKFLLPSVFLLLGLDCFVFVSLLDLVHL